MNIRIVRVTPISRTRYEYYGTDVGYYPAIPGRWAVLVDGKLVDSRYSRKLARKTVRRLKEAENVDTSVVPGTSRRIRKRKISSP